MDNDIQSEQHISKSDSSRFVMKFRGYTKRKKFILTVANLTVTLALLSCSWFLVKEQVRA